MQNKVRVPKIPGNSRFALERWFYKLYTDDLLFNPDDRPEDIVHIGTNEPFFSRDTGARSTKWHSNFSIKEWASSQITHTSSKRCR